jgi:ABC-type polysaccharide/polyol phosphate transport system ATPase subunit
MSSVAVRFENVTKAYDLFSSNRTLVSSIRSVTGAGKPNSLFHALSDVSFEIRKGEAFGIIGRNGAGKSTILKLIAGITRPTAGTIEVNGLVSSLIELGAGFHPDMTGRENVYMSAAILGIPKKFIDQKFNGIVDFAELWEFIDVPVKKYSSGMYARLGFAVAISVEPEILIVDEILSVGDVFFQQKCFATMREIIAKGTTFIYVTHDTVAMQNLCDRTLLLDNGKVEFIGSTTEAVNRYFARVGQKADKKRSADRKVAASGIREEPLLTIKEIKDHSILSDDKSRHGRKGLEIVAARVSDENGNDTFSVPILDHLLFHLVLRANEDIECPSSGINLYDRMGNLVFAAGTPQLKHPLPHLCTGQQIVVQFDLTFSVSPGEYTFSLMASEPAADANPNIGYFHDQYDMLGPITVVADSSSVFPFYGVAQIPMVIKNGEPSGV